MEKEIKEKIKFIQIIPVQITTNDFGNKQTNLYGLDTKGRIWCRSYCNWNKWKLSRAKFVETTEYDE